MNRLLICIALISSAKTAMADITITDGGYTVSVTDRVSGLPQYAKRESFTVSGTGSDAIPALNQAAKLTVERTKEFGCNIDKMLGATVVTVPTVLTQPCPPAVSTVPCPAPCLPACPPAAVPTCVPPPGGVPGSLHGIVWSRCGAYFQANVPGRGWRRFDVPYAARHLYAARPSSITGWFFYTGRTGCLLSLRDSCTCVDLIDP